MSDKLNEEVLEVVRNWNARTKRVLLYELKKRDIGISDELMHSLDESVSVSGTEVTSRFMFLPRGRFVDMGAGRKPTGEPRKETNGSRKGRKPNPWYSRAFYGRLNDLQGVLGYKLMQSSVEAIKENLKE